MWTQQFRGDQAAATPSPQDQTVQLDRALRAHLPDLYALHPVPDEFIRLAEAWSRRRGVDP